MKEEDILKDENFLLKDLNSQQKKAVLTLSGPLLISAGAGSGKTRALTYRIALLILKKLAAPQNILAITFTNKAASEMRSRVLELLRRINFISLNNSFNLKDLWISTFHAFCVRVLRSHIHRLGFSSTFTIFDQSDQLSLIKKVLFRLKIDEKTYSPKLMASKINQAKTKALRPQDVEKKAFNFLSGSFIDPFLEVYKTYEKDKTLVEALDFGDLLLKVYELFVYFPDILSNYQDFFKYIFIDEYQDTNFIQYQVAQKIASKHQNLCVTGDEDQSIYSWRGADIKNILNFKKDFPRSTVVKLEQNYRSTQSIVEAAHFLIQNNQLRQKKTLFTRNQRGSRVLLKESENETEEAFFVVSKILSLVKGESDRDLNADSFPFKSYENSGKSEGSKNSYEYKDFSVFYRTNAQSRALEDMMKKHSLPYKIVGGLRFYDRMEVKDMISYLRLIFNLKDDLSLKRILNRPPRGIGKVSLEKLEEIASKNQSSLFEAISHGVQNRLFGGRALQSFKSFYFLIEDLKEKSKILNPLDLYFFLLDRTGYRDQLKKEASLEASERLKNLEELAYVIGEFEKEDFKSREGENREGENEEDKREKVSLMNWLEEMALTSYGEDEKNNPNSISLMTLHMAKGLEFPNVFITGLEEGLLPSTYSWDETREAALEEERRLFYVGMTRAKENLFLSYAMERQRWGREEIRSRSSFLEEIPEHLLEVERLGSNFSSGEDSFSLVGSSRFLKRSSEKNLVFNSDLSSKKNLFSKGLEDLEGLNSLEYREGMAVHHSIFGRGVICKVDGLGQKKKLSICFDASKRVKKFLANSPFISRL